MITNSQSGTRIDEIADRIYRINTPVSTPGGPFSFNQYLILGEEPLLFHTGPAALFPVVTEAIESTMPIVNLRYIGFSHFEADECGALNLLLARSPSAVPVCSRIAAMTSVYDYASRPPRVLGDSEELSLGDRHVRWFETPHLPHSWESGLMMDLSTHTLFCGDLFTQGGSGAIALLTEDILGPSEIFRSAMDYFANTPETGAMLDRLARQLPRTLACMHGSAWSGDGANLLQGLRDALAAGRRLAL
jgi:flavorubredoxin